MKRMMVLLALMTLAACSLKPNNPSQFEQRIGSKAYQSLNKASAAVIITKETEKKLSPEQVEKLKTLLLRDEGYIFDRTKKCLFFPQHTFSFDDGQTQVIISQVCKQIKVVSGDKGVILDYDPMQQQINEFINKDLK